MPPKLSTWCILVTNYGALLFTNRGAYLFTSYKLLGKTLPKAATFTVDPSSTQWVLDMNNGKSITYTIISGNGEDALCGLKAKDSFGTRCEICIKNTGGTSTTVIFNYSGDRFVYKGNYIN